MAIVTALVVIIIFSVLFHLISPWWLTPLASGWHEMDTTMEITLIVTGGFFVVLNAFLVYTLIRYRNRPDGASSQSNGAQKAAYQPENSKLERWLLISTAVGVAGLLAPGLFVYANYVHAPQDAMEVQVLGQQWQWRLRFPGDGGKFGRTSVSLITPANPFGIDAKDTASGGNIVIDNNEVHLPLGKPIKVLLSSNDVLHDFFVPPFRARMNIVPGMITSFWFTPTKAGRYEALCAQLCGLGHANMRGYVIIEEESTFRAWLKKQPTFAATMMPAAAAASSGASPSEATPADTTGTALSVKGLALSQSKGCVSCHTVDGKPGVGPSWKGLYGKTETMTDESTLLVDEAYLKKFIRQPNFKVIKGYTPIMPKMEMTDDELTALVAYIQTLGDKPVTAR